MMAGAGAQEIVGKKELCAIIGWSRPRLDRRLIEDARFPVERRGDQSGGWGFAPVKVQRYLSGAPAPEKECPPPKKRTSGGRSETVPAATAPKGMDLAQLRDTVKKPLPKEAEETAHQVVDALKGAADRKQNGRASPRRSAYHVGEAGAKQRDLEASASLKEDKLRVTRGELVDKGELRQVLATAMARLGHDLDALPEKIAKQLERDDLAPGIRALVDQVRTEMVRGLEPLLAETEATK